MGEKLLVLIWLALSGVFAVYMFLPSPSGIEDFSYLPNSVKSTLEGDTIHVPNVAGFFSNNYRDFVINFYKEEYMNNVPFGFEPMSLVHPPEHAFAVIKDQTQSTYLVELTYPFRDSLYVNGLEPFDQFTKEKRYSAAKDLVGDDGNTYETKVTVRYYPSPLWARVFVWLGINISIVILFMIYKKVIVHD